MNSIIKRGRAVAVSMSLTLLTVGVVWGQCGSCEDEDKGPGVAIYVKALGALANGNTPIVIKGTHSARGIIPDGQDEIFIQKIATLQPGDRLLIDIEIDFAASPGFDIEGSLRLDFGDTEACDKSKAESDGCCGQEDLQLYELTFEQDSNSSTISHLVGTATFARKDGDDPSKELGSGGEMDDLKSGGGARANLPLGNMGDLNAGNLRWNGTADADAASSRSSLSLSANDGLETYEIGGQLSQVLALDGLVNITDVLDGSTVIGFKASTYPGISGALPYNVSGLTPSFSFEVIKTGTHQITITRSWPNGYTESQSIIYGTNTKTLITGTGADVRKQRWTLVTDTSSLREERFETLDSQDQLSRQNRESL